MDKIEITNMGVNDINLDKAMYEKAYKMGMSFSQFLEGINPSELSDPLDAFERQCKRFGVALKSIPEKGIWASKGDMFFQSNQPASRILFPEFLNRTARAAALEDYSITDITANIRPIDSGSYRTLYINDSAGQRRKARVGEGAGFPKTKVSWSEGAGAVKKHGVEIEMSYEFVRRADIPLIQLVIQRIIMQDRIDDFGDAIDILINGDEFVVSSNAATVYNLTDLDSDAVAGTLTYKGYLKFGNLFRPIKFNTALGNIDTILQVVLCPKPSTDPIQLLSLLQLKEKVLNGESVTIVNPAWGQVRLIVHDDVDTNLLVGIDKRYALEQIVEIGADLQETNRLIDTQFEQIVLSNSTNFAKIFETATKVLDIGH